MPTFERIESGQPTTSVFIDMPGIQGSGMLELKGDKTRAVLNTSEAFRFGAKRSGWFDVRLRDGDGKRILLHNAISLETRMPHAERSDYGETLFPNIIVFEADCLGKGDMVRKVSFSTAKLADFFHYQHYEWHSMYRADAKVRRSIRDLRRMPQIYPREYDVFAPDDVYVTHRVPTGIKFRVDDRVYRASSYLGGGSNGFNKVTLQSEAFAEISFDRPISIDAALDHVWDWRRFFQQLAMEPLPVLSMSLKGTARNDHRWASVLMPNLSREPGANTNIRSFNAGEAPFNDWSERHNLAKLMQAWLSKNAERRLFRAMVDNVLTAPHGIELNHINGLTAAIDSLNELKGTAVSKEDLDVLAAGAVAAARAHNIDVPETRINAVIGGMKNQPLRQKLKATAKPLASILTSKDANRLITEVLELRRTSAHGHAVADMTLPTLMPTVRALVGLCVMWDLATCGAEVDWAQVERCKPRSILRDEGFYLMHIKRNLDGR